MNQRFSANRGRTRNSVGGRRRQRRNNRNNNRINLGRGRFKNTGTPVNQINSRPNFLPTQITSNSLGFPDEMNVTLAYFNDLQLQSSVGEQQMIYEGNNPWDPDPQLGGVSADQYQVFMSVYRYCRVYSSTIEVNYNIINSDGFQCVVAPLAENDSIAYEMLASIPRSKTGRMVSVYGPSSSRIVNSASTASLYGTQNLDYDLSNQFSLINTGSSVATEPVRKWYWHVAFQNNASQNSLNGTAKVRIFYKCHFYGRKYQPNLSTVTSDGTTSIPILSAGNSTVEINDPI